MPESCQIRRLHWGCGKCISPEWINCDIKKRPGVDIACDILDGLPLEESSIDYISSQHVLPEIKIYDQLPALRELRRVLKQDGVLRLSLPDLDKAISSYQNEQIDYFKVWDWDTISGRFITHLLWHNAVHTLFTYEFIEELLTKSGFKKICRVAYHETSSLHPAIVELDNRPEESFYVEAYK